METFKQIEKRAALVLKPLRCGLRARAVVLPIEDRSAFNELCDAADLEWRPQTPSERFYLEQMVVSQWKLARLEAGDVEIFREIGSAVLDRRSQWQCRLERSYATAQRELERLQRARPRPAYRSEEPPPGRPQNRRSASVVCISTAAKVGSINRQEHNQ